MLLVRCGGGLANRTSPGRFELLRRMRRRALATSGVAEALYREPNPKQGGRKFTLDGAHPAWQLAGARTGDLVVTHDADGAFSDPGSIDDPLVGNHGGPQTRDNFFAAIGRRGSPLADPVGNTGPALR